jgi:hypothetical protein
MLEDRTITIVHGTDFTNVSYTNFCAFKVEVALLWSTELGNYIRYVVTANKNFFHTININGLLFVLFLFSP